MTQYIDKEIAKQAIAAGNMHKGIIDAMQSLFDDIPAAYMQEIKHGHWIVYQDEGTALCSNCRMVFEDRGDTIPDYWYFCPKCGAKMDGDRND